MEGIGHVLLGQVGQLPGANQGEQCGLCFVGSFELRRSGTLGRDMSI